MSALAEILASFAIVVGAVFTLVGSYGLVKLDKPMPRLHAPTKASTLGVGSLLAGSVLYSAASGRLSLHELLILAFLFVTAPVSAHFIAKIHIHRDHTKQELPAPPEDSVWATKDVAGESKTAS